ncbi:glucokinase, partial [Ascosphaera acerosa]
MSAIPKPPVRGSGSISPVVLKAKELAGYFEYSTDSLRAGVTEFLREMEEGLAAAGSTLPQIPTYVTAVPRGDEKGLYLAVDLGGTNFRVCSVDLHGDGTYSLRQSKARIPHELMVAGSYKALFAFMAERVEAFIHEHLSEHWTSHHERKRQDRSQAWSDAEYFDLGFTFSYPVEQHAINKGTLMRWTKGFDIAEAVGRDVCEMFQEALDAARLPVRVAALVNDTVGTLMARAYTSRAGDRTLMGAIFGTGTNGAYVERAARIGKMATAADASAEMIINCEWGSFDNPLKVLPTTRWDVAVDADTPNRGFHMFEKRVSGMFLGELLRRVMVEMAGPPEGKSEAESGSSTPRL